MQNRTQLERYKKLVNYLDQHFKEDIDIRKVEDICHYSYRNINRIFQALHQETIGKYIKRLRLEKAAQLLKYSQNSITDIAFEFGFNDAAAFNKAFRTRFQVSPSAYRKGNELLDFTGEMGPSGLAVAPEKLSFEIRFLPEIELLYLEYRGAYGDFKAIEQTWENLYEYASEKQLLTPDSILLAEILDDDEISEDIHCRYRAGVILDRPLGFMPDGLFGV